MERRILYLAILALFLSAELKYSQEDLIKGALDVIDIFNKKLLDITALSDEEENLIGDELHKMIIKDKKLLAKHKKFNVEKVFNKVKANVKRKNIKYEYAIMEDNVINAYAIAGGKVYLLTGLLDVIESEDELAFVIAHEIAHNEAKHCIHRIQYAVRASQIHPELGNVVMTAYDIYHLPFSKDDEFEADKIGVELMVKAGYNKKGAIAFFRRLQKMHNPNNNKEENDFLATHPNYEARIKRIESY